MPLLGSNCRCSTYLLAFCTLSLPWPQSSSVAFHQVKGLMKYVLHVPWRDCKALCKPIYLSTPNSIYVTNLRLRLGRCIIFAWHEAQKGGRLNRQQSKNNCLCACARMEPVQFCHAPPVGGRASDKSRHTLLLQFRPWLFGLNKDFHAIKIVFMWLTAKVCHKESLPAPSCASVLQHT